MEAFLVSFGLVALAEIGDKTQLLALVLASRFHRPVPILAGILTATLLNHLAAAALGAFLGIKIEGAWVRWVIAASFFAIAIWAFIPERGDVAAPPPRFGVYGATVCAFFVAEMGDRTQIATVALAARFASWLLVVGGTTAGLMAANLPVVLLGRHVMRWIPMRAVHWVAALVSAALGVAALLEPR
ncbi:MAG: TMEM165/GDT1 family protein [Alphaproteobacteria bacterium]|nr:TMEM165/GDT1 family protein [Alphaproteobacteria bacterium]MBV9862480.1 TMEM165/GDT1 family protein [Alphaproteobacteria bacterium]